MTRKKLKLFIAASFIAGTLSACGGGNDDDSVSYPNIPPATAKTEKMALVFNKQFCNSAQNCNEQESLAKVQKQLESHYGIVDTAVSSRSLVGARSNHVDYRTYPAWDANKIYLFGDEPVKREVSADAGIYRPNYWNQNDDPSAALWSWTLVLKFDPTTGRALAALDAVPNWTVTKIFQGGQFAKYNNLLYKASYYNVGRTPGTKDDNLTPIVNGWESPWVETTETPSLPAPIPKLPDKVVLPAPAGDTNKNPVNPVLVPPLVPASDPVERGESVIVSTELNTHDGYAFLKKLTPAIWDRMFPFRYGRLNTEGGTNNKSPVASADGSKDVFTLSNFINAVLQYNVAAKKSNSKQFLNEGDETTQALEFSIFVGKTMRETSGNWEGAPAPWATDCNYGNIPQKCWWGGLYWNGEIGYTDNADGTSPNISYVDLSYPNVAGRSYHGRGPIQLSWNYNYLGFSKYLYAKGLFPDIITSHDTLLTKPNLVNANGAIAFMSGIWFFMTAQGDKPSSHDVVLGNVMEFTHNSQPGMAKLVDYTTNTAMYPLVQGPITRINSASTTDTNNLALASRIGTVINIVNGGLECNRQSSWHTGPKQRVAYVFQYAQLLNQELGLQIPIINRLVNIWTEAIVIDDANNPTNSILNLATCNGLRPYGW